MRIAASTSTGLNLHPRGAGADARDTTEPPVRTTLPAVIARPDNSLDTDRSASSRSNASFLAQLVAGAEDLPTSRVRRRADPATAIGCYLEIAGLTGGHSRPPIRLI